MIPNVHFRSLSRMSATLKLLFEKLQSQTNLRFMKENLIPFKNSRKGKILFILSIIVSGYWWMGQVINVYNSAFAGAIFEILWLPFLLILFVLPIISLILLMKEKFNIRSFNIYSIIISVITILFMIFSK
jgi:hypothetical protein